MFTQQSTIHGKYHGKTGYLLRNADAGTGEFAGIEYYVDDMQMAQTDESQMMTYVRVAQVNCTNQSHKQIAQNDHAKQDDVTSRNGNDERT